MANGKDDDKKLSTIGKRLQEKQAAPFKRETGLGFGAVVRNINRGASEFFGVGPQNQQSPAAVGAQSGTQAAGAAGGRSALPGATNTGGGAGTGIPGAGGSQDAPGLTAGQVSPSNRPRLPIPDQGPAPVFGRQFGPRGTSTSAAENLAVAGRLSDRFRQESLARLGQTPAQIQERELASEEARLASFRTPERLALEAIPSDVRIPTDREERLNPGSREAAIERNKQLAAQRTELLSHAAQRARTAAAQTTAANKLDLETRKAAASQNLQERRLALDSIKAEADAAAKQGRLGVELGKLDLDQRQFIFDQSKEIKDQYFREQELNLDRASTAIKGMKLDQDQQSMVIAAGTEIRQLTKLANETGDASVLGQIGGLVDALGAQGIDVEVLKRLDPTFVQRNAKRIKESNLDQGTKLKLLGELGVDQTETKGDKLF